MFQNQIWIKWKITKKLITILLVSTNKKSVRFVMCFISCCPLPSVMQDCISGAPQGDPSTVCHEEDQPAELDAEESNPAGVCGARHPHLC